MSRTRYALQCAIFLFLSSATVAAAAPCLQPADAQTAAQQVVDGINAERKAHGLKALTPNSKLTSAALAQACDNAARRSISHVSSDGSELQHRLRKAGYRFRMASENTGRGFGVAPRAVAFWMNSPPHRQNILSQKTQEIGVGVTLSAAPDSKYHWIVVFGTPR